MAREYASRDQIYHLNLRNTTVRTQTPLEYYTTYIDTIQKKGQITRASSSHHAKYRTWVASCDNHAKYRTLGFLWLKEADVVENTPRTLPKGSRYVRSLRVLHNFRLRMRTPKGTPKGVK